MPPPPNLQQPIIERECLYEAIDNLQPPALLKLTPNGFYTLRQFSYLVALAATSYVGADPIERAFKEKSDRPIAEAVEAIRWPDFLRFVERYAREGDADQAIVWFQEAGGMRISRGVAEYRLGRV